MSTIPIHVNLFPRENNEQMCPLKIIVTRCKHKNWIQSSRVPEHLNNGAQQLRQEKQDLKHHVETLLSSETTEYRPV
jgi:hypothetical protein